VAATYRSATQYTTASSEFSTDTGTVAVDYGWPISEFQSVRSGLAWSRSDLLTDPNGSPLEQTQWVRDNGDTYSKAVRYGVPEYEYTYYGTKFDTYTLSLGWSFDSRNRALFATNGSRHRVNMTYTLPFSGVDFYTVNYDYLQFIPISRLFTFMINADVAYGDSIGDTTAIPPYRRFFAGGPESVRGFDESRLGPKDSFGNPYGGNLRVVSQFELLLPMPEKFRNSARFSVFFDAGNVFSTDDTTFVGQDGFTPVEYNFAFDEIRYSTGIAVQWLAPLGVFRFSYAVPLNAKDGEGVEYDDETQGFQFSIGQAF
jgi:outer membrane protein insertion porin family